jgi:tRNA-modifying protein YgfZ
MLLRSGADLLRSGEAFADLSGWTKVGLSGADAAAWLDDLVSADLSGLGSGLARRALLLSPTGAIRAEFTVAVHEGTILVIQGPGQPRSIGALLAPYVLSSDVVLEDRTDDLSLFALPGESRPPEVPLATPSTPSCTGRGTDLLAPAGDRDRVAGFLSKTLVQVTADDLEAWRISAGFPRVGVDVDPDDLPEEAGLGRAVSYEKGCYLGQEAVAKVRNLGHPRRLVLAFDAAGPAAVGDPILRGESEAGRITSATDVGGGRTRVLARIRWDARDASLTTGAGVPLRSVEDSR